MYQLLQRLHLPMAYAVQTQPCYCLLFGNKLLTWLQADIAPAFVLTFCFKNPERRLDICTARTAPRGFRTC